MTTTPSCPQCGCKVFHLISADLRRCADCRWLWRLQADGTAATAFDPWQRPQRSRRQSFKRK